MSHVIFIYNILLVQLVGGGSVITRVNPVYFIPHATTKFIHFFTWLIQYVLIKIHLTHLISVKKTLLRHKQVYNKQHMIRAKNLPKPWKFYMRMLVALVTFCRSTFLSSLISLEESGMRIPRSLRCLLCMKNIYMYFSKILSERVTLGYRALYDPIRQSYS